MPLNNQSWNAYFAPYNPVAYESILKNAANKNEIVKMIFDCRLDPTKCVRPTPMPHPSVYPLPSPVPCAELGECPEPIPCWADKDCPDPIPPPCLTKDNCPPPPIYIGPPVEIEPVDPPGYIGPPEIMPVEPPQFIGPPEVLPVDPPKYLGPPISIDPPQLDNQGPQAL